MKSPKKRESVDNNEKSTMLTARGRLKGALKDVVDVNEDESSGDEVQTEEEKRMIPVRGRPPKKIKLEFNSIPTSQSFIMKLFDRSVDLVRYNDDSPLYPICRDWMINQPNAMKHSSKKPKLVVPKRERNDDLIDLVRDKKITEITTLPAPKPIEISRIPELLPIQLKVNKDNINLDYDLDNPSIAREELLTEHRNRWSQVRKSWNEQTKLCDERYKTSIDILGMIGMK